MDRLKGKVCLITGAGNGIGAEIAKQFALNGAFTELCDIDEIAVKMVSDDINKSGGNSSYKMVDVSNVDAIQSWISYVIEKHTKINVLVNNAGVSAVGRIDEISDQTWNRVLSINLTGVFLLSRAVLPHMMKAGSGNVINMSSSIAEHGLARRAAYAATKGAILSMTKSMQVDYAPYNIRVNALMPGTVLTPFVKNYIKTSYNNEEEALENLKKRQLSNSLGDPYDIAMAAVYLASDESKYMMGAGLLIDGGTNAGKPY